MASEYPIFNLFDSDGNCQTDTIPSQELCDRTLQARRHDPDCTIRQARLRALAAAREARELNRVLTL